ncbi:MAG: hypothetical protein Q8O27_00120 [Enterobacteriaceae bacterium]|nr:hypothetical protein [Enterobacteriaceae bacterium]
MQITELLWDEETILHIWIKHKVEPQEIEEACFSETPPSIEVGRGGAPIYYVLGKSCAERYLFIVVKYLYRGRAKPITARDMDQKEKRRYQERRRN